MGNSQSDAVSYADYNLSIITGLPGTGKTYIQAVISDQMIHDGYTVICTAPTGTAAKKLYQSCIRSGNVNGDVVWMTLQRFVMIGRDAHYAKHEQAILFVDESSMVDMFLMLDLLRIYDSRLIIQIRLNDDIQRNVLIKKIVFTGDTNQLPSIRQGCVLLDMITHIPTTMLTRIHRQSEESVIVKNARLLLQGDSRFLENNNFKIHYTSNMKEHMLNLSNSLQTMMLVQGNETVKALNLDLQQKHNPYGNDIEMQISTTNKYTPKGYVYKVGDPVYIIKSNIVEDCINGHKTIILGVNKEMILLEEKDNLKPNISINDVAEYLAPAYCGNVYKAQGQEADDVVFCLDWNCDIQFRQLLYTAMTRAKRNFVLVLDNPNKLNMAVKHTRQRNTYLRLLMNQMQLN